MTEAALAGAHIATEGAVPALTDAGISRFLADAAKSPRSAAPAEGVDQHRNCTLVFSANQALLAARAIASAHLAVHRPQSSTAVQDGMEVLSRESVRIMETYHLPISPDPRGVGAPHAPRDEAVR